MMSFMTAVKKLEKFTMDNSPLILTAIGVTGTITTAILTGKASYKAAYILEDERVANLRRGDDALTNREKFELIWKLYIPAAGVGTMTVVSIIGANRIGTRRAAAMAAAYSISERAFDEYREKVVEKLGAKKEREARDEIAQSKVDRDPPGNSKLVVMGSGEVLCKDAWSGRYFTSDMESMKKAQNDTNHEVLTFGYASLTDFYNRLGLEPTKESDEVGWNSDKPLELYFSTTIADDERPCLVMDFTVSPVRNYFRTH